MVSRRGFLRGGAALPVALSTGGASAAVTGGAASAGGLALALSAAERKARAAMALAKHGGFPITELMSFFKWGHSSERTSDELKDVFKTLFSNGEPGHYKGLIDLENEKEKLSLLNYLPKGIPLRDFLTPEMLKEASNEDMQGRDNPFRSEFGEKDLSAIVSALGPYMDEDTTVEDLQAVGREFFAKMARRFLDNPKEFAGTFYEGWNVSTSLQDMITDWSKNGDGEQLHKGVIDALGEKKDRYSRAHDILMRRRYLRDAKQRDAQVEVEIGQRRAAAEERAKIDARKLKAYREQKQAEAQKRLENPDARAPFYIDIMRGERGEYLVDQKMKGRVLKMDWLQFVQSISPKTAKPKDVEIRLGGLMVAFHNKAVVSALEERFKECTQDWIKLEIPNRRAGVDLNAQNHNHFDMG